MKDYDVGEHNKTVYAHFGLAIFLAQCLEHELVNSLVYLDLIPSKAHLVRTKDEWAAEFDAFMDRHFEHTLGRMIGDLGRVTAVPTELEANLSKALRTRNWLAHDFFRERARDFMTETGRNRMIVVLETAQSLFREADQMLHAAFKPVREKYGFTDERLAQAYEQMQAELQD